MYSFDVSQENAFQTYNEAYTNIFEKLQIPYAIALADSGTIGGSMSHEFHAIASIGEDSLLHCSTCKFTANVEKTGNKQAGDTCVDVNCNGKLTASKGIEVGHIFLPWYKVLQTAGGLYQQRTHSTDGNGLLWLGNDQNFGCCHRNFKGQLWTRLANQLSTLQSHSYSHGRASSPICERSLRYARIKWH